MSWQAYQPVHTAKPVYLLTTPLAMARVSPWVREWWLAEIFGPDGQHLKCWVMPSRTTAQLWVEEQVGVAHYI